MSSCPSASSSPERSADERADALGDRHAAGMDADERDRLEVVVALDDLVRNPGKRPADRLLVEEDPL